MAAPNELNNARVINERQQELRFGWDQPEEEAPSVDEVTAVLFDAGGAVLDTKVVTERRVSFTGLTQFTSYTVELTPSNADGDGPVSTLEATTAAEARNSAFHLLYGHTQGRFQLLYLDYIRNMKPLREFPTHWRFVDTMSFCDGPDGEDGSFSRNRETWRAEVNGADPTLIELFNEQNLGQRAAAEEAQHDEPVKSLSIEFDQSGRFLVAFEDVTGQIYLNWYDPEPQRRVNTLMGPGRTPCFASTRYDKTGGSGDSERVFFYVDADTDQVVYRRQSERWQTANPLPDAPGPVAELLNVGKSMYGGLVVAGCYDTGFDTVEPVFWNAPDSRGLAVNTDRDALGWAGFSAAVSKLHKLELYHAVVSASGGIDSGSFAALQAQLGEITLERKVIESGSDFFTTPDAAAVTATAGALAAVSVESKVVKTGTDFYTGSDTAAVGTGTAVLASIDIYHATIRHNLGAETAAFSAGSAALSNIHIGA